MKHSRNLDSYPDILLPEEAARILQIGRNTIYRLLKEGKLKSVRVGKLYRIPKSAMVEFINNCGL